MSRMTKPLRSATSRRVSAPFHGNVGDVPRVSRRFSLVCGACGASGKYDVGTVTIGPTVDGLPDDDAMQEAVGFTGYFRCRKCDAGGPWEIPDDTLAYIMAMSVVVMAGAEDVPLVFGGSATFDQHVFRYATECEDHLKELIEDEPDRAFLWVRLGNLYSHAGLNQRAEAAYQRAIELDPTDIEAHGMFGQLLFATDRRLEAVPHWHAILKHVREARNVSKELRRNLVHGAIRCLLAAHAESHGQIDLLPKVSPEEMEERSEKAPVVLELREFDLGSEKGVDELCNAFLEPPRRRWLDMFSRREKMVPEASQGRFAAPIRREALHVGRNEYCPCGSGHKYKKCCGR